MILNKDFVSWYIKEVKNMPYDKGDFTQQGIDGKVSGGLLLNNKRDVDVLVSTNEEDSTLDLVAVTIEDHLNDLKYAFWGENLEAGEVYEIGAGGGGDYGDLRWVIPIQECTLTGLETEPNIATVNENIQDYQLSIIFNIYYTEDDVEYCDSFVCEYHTIGDDFYYDYSDDSNLLTVFIQNDKATFWYGTSDHQTVYDGDYKISAVGIFKFNADGGGGNE